MQPEQPKTIEARAKILLPALGADEALRLVAILYQVVDAIWQAHGHEMSERLIDSARPLDITTEDVLPEDDQDFPF